MASHGSLKAVHDLASQWVVPASAASGDGTKGRVGKTADTLAQMKAIEPKIILFFVSHPRIFLKGSLINALDEAVKIINIKFLIHVSLIFCVMT